MLGDELYPLLLYLITKLQNLKAIHNVVVDLFAGVRVVSNYKITKSESYSQQRDGFYARMICCI